jgi:hypothetical protein
VSAVEALRAARAAGIELAVDGDDLALNAASAPPEAMLEALSRNKAEIVALLRPGRDGWSGEDWLTCFEERAGIAEFDGGLPRGEAEARAFECCVVEWLNLNPVCSPPGRCLGCGAGERAYDKLLPFGTEQTGHAWLHSRCWPAWHADRRADAIAALSLILNAGRFKSNATGSSGAADPAPSRDPGKPKQDDQKHQGSHARSRCADRRRGQGQG